MSASELLAATAKYINGLDDADNRSIVGARENANSSRRKAKKPHHEIDDFGATRDHKQDVSQLLAVTSEYVQGLNDTDMARLSSMNVSQLLVATAKYVKGLGSSGHTNGSTHARETSVCQLLIATTEYVRRLNDAGV